MASKKRHKRYKAHGNLVFDMSKPITIVNMLNHANYSMDNIDKIPKEHLIKYLKALSKGEIGRRNGKIWDMRVASPSSILVDLKNFGYDLLTPELRENLMLRTSLGHANAGHSSFRSSYAPPVNTTIEDIVSNSVLRNFKDKNGDLYFPQIGKLSPRRNFLVQSQGYINDIADKLVEAMDCQSKYIDMDVRSIRKNDKVGKIASSPLLGVPFLKGLKVNSLALLMGFFYGANFDNYETIRFKGEQRYLKGMDRKIGGGTSVLLNVSKARKLGIDLSDFTLMHYKNKIFDRMSNEKRFDLFSDKRVDLFKKIPDLDFSVGSWKEVLEQGYDYSRVNHYIPHYFRLAKGKGVSDDIAIMNSVFLEFEDVERRKLYGNLKFDSVARLEPEWFVGLQVGAWLADFVDTIEKGSQFYLPGGQDEAMGRFINARWLDKVRKDPYYRKLHSIDIDKIEKRVAKHGEDYALVDKNEIIDLTIASMNPKNSNYLMDYTDDPRRPKEINLSLRRDSIHSSQSYFLRKQVAIKKGDEDIKSTAIEQEFYLTSNYLEKMNIDMKKDGKYLIDGKLFHMSGIHIGFERQPFNQIILYAMPIFSTVRNVKDRQERISRYLNENNIGV